jgi:5-formyltetrahydrofolate cyclo-ligase
VSASTDLKRAKRRMRAEVLARRDAMSPIDRERASHEIAGHVLSVLREGSLEASGTVSAFWSFGSEVSTEPLIRALDAEGRRLALPRIVEGDIEMREFRPGDPLSETPFGVWEPAGGARIDAAQLAAVLTPGVAFDRRGFRVGYGGGHYDRLFTRITPGALRVGICFAAQLVDEVPRGSIDRPVAIVVTEGGPIVADLNGESNLR